MADGKPLRVLHVIKHVGAGGIESWLLYVARFHDPRRVRMDILVRREKPAELIRQYEALGVRVLKGPNGKSPAAFARRFLQVVEDEGPYDIVHCHSMFKWGLVLRLARRAGVPVRLAHQHGARHYGASGPGRRAFVAFRHWLYDRWWTGGLAVSRPAARGLFGPGWESDPRFRVLYCGVDMDSFGGAPDPGVRRELGIPEDAWVIGHLGRFSPEKNHGLILEAAAHAMRRDPTIWTLLIGTGEDFELTRSRARALDVGDRFVFAGFRQDVPRLLTSAVDALIFPSLWEGLGLAAVEAQAAGLRVLASDGVPDETDIVPGMVEHMSIAQPPQAWAERLLAWKGSPPPVGREEALRICRESPFNIRHSVEALQACYEESAAAAR